MKNIHTKNIALIHQQRIEWGDLLATAIVTAAAAVLKEVANELLDDDD